MEKKPRLHLFEAFGVELEYMIVDKTTLDVQPIADVLLKDKNGEVKGETDHGLIAWSNELVSHVIEIKSNGPTPDLSELRNGFRSSIAEINKILDAEGAQLLPGATHPWMNPLKETKLWEHDANEIYHTYDRIFNCRGHGWSNLQSTHINLPFYDDEEFTRLHTAIRFMLPIIPALTASSPILDGSFTGYMDKRLYYYEKNQSKIPILTGKVIPEKLFTKHAYQKHVYDRISQAIKPFDRDNVLNPVWLNSRGAMARFDRGAIEIRIIDIQECPSADLAITALLVHLIKLLSKGKLVSFHDQQSFETGELYVTFKKCMKEAGKAMIDDPRYLAVLGCKNPVSGQELWGDLIVIVSEAYPKEMAEWLPLLEQINSHGTLAERIVKTLDGDMSRENLHLVYARLARSLKQDQLFLS